MLRAAPVVALAGAYGYWASDQAPFHVSAYLAVGVPIVLVIGVLLFRRTREPTSQRHVAALTSRSVRPWLVIGALMVALEAVGLAVGGRSADVPTLSTVVDHAVSWHPARLLMFVIWLAGGYALAGRWHRQG